MAFSRHRIEKLTTFGAVAMEAATLSLFLYVTADTLGPGPGGQLLNDLADKGMAEGDLMVLHAPDGRGEFKVTDITAGGVTVKRTGAVSGRHVTVDENNTVVTGLSKVAAVVATLDDDPVDGCQHVTPSIGDQAGAPAAASFLLKSSKNTDADATHVAAMTFGKKVNWIAFGC